LKKKVIRKILLIIWLSVLAFFWGYYFYDPQFISTDNLEDFLMRFESHLLIAYTIISALRAFTLLPSSTFVIVGTLLFSSNYYMLLFVSIIGILISSTIIYFFSDFMGFDEYFKKKYPKRIEYFQRKLESKYGLGFMLLWCSLPIAPSDLIFYLAGSLHISYHKFILAVFIGHIFLFSLWILLTDNFLSLFSLN
jgi:uncharacterized membrane protein YdjX (TVP38/TMEM64 family)